MESIEFKNKRTEKIHRRLLKFDKGDYQKYLDSTVTDFFECGDNGKNNNTTIKFDYFQTIGLYNRANRRKVEKIFSKFAVLCKSNKGKYRNLRSVVNETVHNIVDKIDHSFFSQLIDFNINCKLKYISEITMLLDCMGPNLFKIIFNCKLTDLAMYKYWLYACPNIQKELEIKREYHITKWIYNFSKTIGIERKRIMLQEHTNNIYKEINKYLSSIAPGIFSRVYKKMPCTMIASYKIIPEYILTKSHAVYIEPEHTNFFDGIIVSADQYERFIDENSGNTFIPLKSGIMPDDNILMKYFSTDNFLPADMAWINIVHYLLHNQNNLVEMLKNEHYENDLYGKTINIREYKKKMSKLVPLISLIKSSFGSKVFAFDSSYKKYNKYIMELDDENKIFFYDEYKERINYLINILEKEIKSIQEIYMFKYTEINSKINKRMLLVAVFMALMTAFQIFMQCEGNIKQTETNIQKSENNLTSILQRIFQ